MSYFIYPPLVTLEGQSYLTRYKTYSEYNYLQSGISSYLKIRHFEIALRLTRGYFYKSNVIDFGCADGPFLPSLSRYFNYVVGIDRDPNFIEIAGNMCDRLFLNNTELICNNGLKIGDLKTRLSSKKYHIIYILETLEHLGDRDRLYESKIDFLKEVSSLIDDDGIIIVSVPKMTGISFLVKRLGLRFLGQYLEPMSKFNVIKASFLNDTADLEEKWDGTGDAGFNHIKLEKQLKKEFYILQKKDIFFQVMYMIKKHSTSNAS